MAQSGRTGATKGGKAQSRADGASKKGSQPGWLQAVLRLERTIGSQVEEFVRSDAYFDLTAELTRRRKRASKFLEGFQEEWLHLFNLPASTDIRRLREQLARLERELADLTLELSDQRDAAEDGRRRGSSKADSTA